MDAISSKAADLPYSLSRPVLLAASSNAAMARAEQTVEAGGLRIGARMSVAEARARIDRQGAAAAVWIELDEDCGGAMDELLGGIGRDVALGRYSAIVSTTFALLDRVASRIDDNGVELIVDASEPERAAALAIAATQIALRPSICDIGGDQNAERLRQLSEEVNRIAATLARLSNGSAVGSRPVEAAVAGAEAPTVPLETVRNVIRARRLRDNFLPGDLFGDPAWDMLLDLLQAEIAQLRVPVSSLCIAAAVPATTALRWLKTMVSRGLIVRRSDPHDGRRVFVELAPETSFAMRSYFAEVGRVATI